MTWRNRPRSAGSSTPRPSRPSGRATRTSTRRSPSHEYLASGWGEQDWCLQWPVADPAHVAQPPTPIGGHYAAVPTLVLSGELDTITTPAEGALVVAQIPGARQVLVANSTHVTAVDDTDGCGRALVQAFVAAPTAALPAADLQCAAEVPPVRTAPSYAKSFARQRNWRPEADERPRPRL